MTKKYNKNHSVEARISQQLDLLPTLCRRSFPVAKLVALLLVFASSLSSAHAATITFGFNSDASATVSTSGVVTVSAFSAGSGVSTPGVASGKYSGTNWTTATSIDLNDYFGFTFTPQAGYTVAVTGFSLESDRDDAGSSGSGPTAAALRYGKDLTFATFTQSSFSPSGKPAQTFTPAASISSITSSESAAFRIYGWSNAGQNPIASRSWAVDNVVVTFTADSLASQSASLAATPPGRAMKNAANVKFQVDVTNDALSPSGGNAQGLNYSLSLSGANGSSLAAPTSGTGLPRNATASHFVDVDTTTTGAKGGGNVIVTGNNAWRSNGNAGQNMATIALGTVTVVDNRDLAQQGGPIHLGNVLVNFNTSAGTATITGGAADDNSATRVTLGNSNVTQNGVSVGGGAPFTFNGGNQTTTRNVIGNFASSGVKSGNVNIASQLSNAETSISGTPTLDSAVNVAFTATAYDSASLTDNTASTLDSGSNVSLANAGGAFRSAALVDAVSLTPGWTLNNLNVGNAIAAGASTATATITHNDAGLLNNYQVTGTLAIALENDQAITGAAHQDLGTRNWNLSHTVSGQSGSQFAAVGVGGSYANLSGASDVLLSSIATLLDGENDNGPATTVSTSWRNRAAAETAPLNSQNPLASDVLELTGTAGDVLVLELTYDENELTGSESTSAAAGNLFLAWLDGGVWKNAIDGNSGTNTTNPGLLNYQGSWLASGAGLTLGAWGVDITSNVVWAVIDHNSEFAAAEEAEGQAESVPEPAALALAVLGLIALAVGRTLRIR